MNKRTLLNVGDRIVSAKYGRWTVVAFTEDGYMILVKVRKGRVTETWKVRNDKVFGGER